MTDATLNKAEGVVEEIKGKIKEGVGSATGDAGIEAEGKFDQLSGLAQQEFADLYDEGETKLEAAVAFVQDRPLVSLFIATVVGLLVGGLFFGRRGS